MHPRSPGARVQRMLLAASLALAALGCEKPLVQVVPVRVGKVESTATSVESGVVKSRRDSTLASPVSGRIMEIYHKRGDRLKEGEPVVRIENDLERIAVSEAEVDLKRLSALGLTGAAAEEALDHARFALNRAKVNLERTFVRALFPGVLVELNANLGEMSYGTLPLNLMAGQKSAGPQEPLARVVDDSQLYVEAYIDEADSGRLKSGQAARLTFEALGGRVLPGRLVRVGQTISTMEGRSRTVRVEIEPETAYGVPSGDSASAPPELQVGMSADVEVILLRVEGVASVPTLVVLEGEGEKSVFVVEEGRLRKRQVQVGAANWDLTEIKEGVRPGEMVVVPTDRRKLIEGLEVRAEAREGAARP
jgi:HlyD family secretion protein